MDFLSNLAKGVYNTVNSIGSSIASIPQTISDTFTGLTNSIGGKNLTASAGNSSSSNYDNSLSIANPPKSTVNEYGPQMSIAPNASSPNGPVGFYNGVPYMNTPTGPVAANSVLQNTSNVRPITPAVSSVSSPATFTGTTQAERIANARASGTGGYDEVGRALPGLSGLTGTQNFNFSSPIMNSGSTATSGLSGTSGGSSFNGVTSAAGNAGGSSVITTNPDEAKNGKKNTAGAVIITPPVKPLNVPPVPSTIDVASLDKYRQDNAKILANPAALSADDRQTLQNNLEQTIAAAYQKVNALNTTPEKPVIDTQEQMDFLKSLAPHEQMTAKQAMDQAREQVGLPALEAQRIDTLKQLQATNEAFQSIYDDIKKNPDLPKGLAQRRLTELQNQQKTRITQLSNQMDIFNQQISDANQVVNRNFQIFQSDQAEQNRQQDNARRTLSLLISSGAFGAMTDAELNKISSSTGIPVSGLQSVRDKSKNVDAAKIITNEFADGSLKGIDQSTGKVVWSLNGAAKPASSGGGSKTPSNAFIVEGEKGLNASKGSDGYVNTETYINAYNHWVNSEYPANSFFTNYPPKRYINPKDPTVPAFIKSYLPASTGLNFNSI